MTGRPVVSGIGAVFNDAIVERIKQRTVRDAAARIQQRRGQQGVQPLPQADVQLPAVPAPEDRRGS